MDQVFKALADPSRRRLLDNLNARNGQTLGELCEGMEMARQSVSKHLAVLEDANLVSTAWRGREKLHYLNAVPINAIADRWISQYDRARATALADLKTALEEHPVNQSPAFVYTIYIQTTPQRLWQALTDPSFTRRYWGVTFDTDWREGSQMTWHQSGHTDADPDQMVLRSDPFRHLAYTWHTVAPDPARWSSVYTDEELAHAARERRSKVSFDLEEHGDQVKLTVTHDGFDPDSVIRTSISQGWPALLSSLKTLLETGKTPEDGAHEYLSTVDSNRPA